MVVLGKIFMLFEKSLKSLFSGLIDANLWNFVSLKILRANDLIWVILNGFFEAVSTNGMGAFQTIWNSERRTKPIWTKRTLKFVNMEDFHK